MTQPIPSPQAVIDLLPDAVCIVDAQGCFLFVNTAFGRILGYAPDEVLGRTAFELLHPDDMAATLRQVDKIMSGELQRHFRNRYMHKLGHWVDIQWSARWHPEHGVRIAVAREVTELRAAERELERLARLDQLTGLHNRHYLQEELHRITEHARANDTSLAVLYIDMDGFKAVNDRCGHEVGDDLLREVGNRLKIASGATATPARLGGDEFVVLLPGCAEEGEARQFGEFIRSQLSAPYPLAAGTVHLDASVGVALFPFDGRDPASLLAHADRDMYVVKSRRAR